jgi:hypothetical protein
VEWVCAFLPLIAAAIFFWNEKRFAGALFVIVSIVILAGVSDKRVVLSSAMLGMTFERDEELRVTPDRF